MHAHQLRPGDAIVLDGQVVIVRSAIVGSEEADVEFYGDHDRVRIFLPDAKIDDATDHNVA